MRFLHSCLINTFSGMEELSILSNRYITLILNARNLLDALPFYTSSPYFVEYSRFDILTRYLTHIRTQESVYCYLCALHCTFVIIIITQ